MKIFLTGGTGFIGSHFLSQCMDAGHTVIAQRRPGSVPRLNLVQQPTWIDRPLDHDFTPELVDSDVVVHLAAHTPNPPYASLPECMYWNVFVSTKFLMQAANAGVRNVIAAGSCFEYGLAAEGQYRVHPASDLRPVLAYPISKASASIAYMGMVRQLGLNGRLLRIFQTYGEGEAAARFWPSLCAAAKAGRDFDMSDGSQIRDFISVEEVAKQFVNALDFTGAKPGTTLIRNIGTGEGQTLLAFANYWWKELDAKGELRAGRVERRAGEIKRLVANIQDIHFS